MSKMKSTRKMCNKRYGKKKREKGLQGFFFMYNKKHHKPTNINSVELWCIFPAYDYHYYWKECWVYQVRDVIYCFYA